MSGLSPQVGARAAPCSVTAAVRNMPEPAPSVVAFRSQAERVTLDSIIGRKTASAVHIDFTRSESAWVYELEGLPRLRIWHHTVKGRTDRTYYIDEKKMRDLQSALDVLNGVKTLEEAAAQEIPEHAHRPGRVSIEAQLAEIDYELEQRKTVYARIATSNPGKARENELHVERMQAVRATLVWLRDQEATIKQRMSY